jgi:hypothetical protein
MDGFFSRFAWTCLDRRSSEYPAILLAEVGTAARPPARKTWSKHAGHQRTLTPHQVSTRDLDEEVGPPPGP